MSAFPSNPWSGINNNNNNKQATTMMSFNTNDNVTPIDAFVCGSVQTRNDARLERAIDAGFVAARRRAPRGSALAVEEGPTTRTLARVEAGVRSGLLGGRRAEGPAPAGVTVRG